MPHKARGPLQETDEEDDEGPRNNSTWKFLFFNQILFSLALSAGYRKILFGLEEQMGLPSQLLLFFANMAAALTLFWFFYGHFLGFPDRSGLQEYLAKSQPDREKEYRRLNFAFFIPAFLGAGLVLGAVVDLVAGFPLGTSLGEIVYPEISAENAYYFSLWGPGAWYQVLPYYLVWILGSLWTWFLPERSYTSRLTEDNRPPALD